MERIDKWKIRARAKKGEVVVDSKGNLHGMEWGELRQFRQEFQKEFCPTCLGYNPEKNDFRKKNHPSDLDDCFHHYIDIIGQCWNYIDREKFLTAKQHLQKKFAQVRSVITLPSDPQRVEQLKRKLEEYESGPSLYTSKPRMDIIYESFVLEELLSGGKVDITEFAKKMNLPAPDDESWQTLAFQHGCIVIEDYCLTGGVNVQAGTGVSLGN